MNLIFILLSICITLFGLLGIYLLTTKKGNVVANRILGLFFLFWSLDFLDGVLLLNGFYFDFPILAFWGEPFTLLYGPLMYFYSILMVHKSEKFILKYYAHLAPAMIVFLLIVYFHLSVGKLEKVTYLKSINELNQPREAFLIFLLMYFHLLIYFLYAKSILNKQDQRFRNFYSNIHLSWVNSVLHSLLAMLILAFCVSILQYLQLQAFYEIGMPLLSLLIIFLFGRIIFRMLDEPIIETANSFTETSSKNKLDDAEAKEIEVLISNALEKDKVYLRPELNLEELSKTIDISPRKTSEVINSRFERNFFDLINSYRIKAAMEILDNNLDSGLTVLEVMYRVGYNSKSSFYTQFKRKTGMTPTQYINMLK